MAENRIKKFLWPHESSSANESFRNDRSFSGLSVGRAEVGESDTAFDFMKSNAPTLSREIRKNKAKQGGGIVSNSNIYTPKNFAEVEDIANAVMQNPMIVVNFEVLLSDESTKRDATRISDFLNGVAYAKGIDVQKINNATFVYSSTSKKEEVVK